MINPDGECLLSRRVILQAPDPVTGARSAADLALAAGTAITPWGIGGAAALKLFDRVLAPATRAQNGPTNLAYIPAAPTRAALAFDAVTGAANIFAGTWESGAGAIHAENEALTWLTQLLVPRAVGRGSARGGSGTPAPARRRAWHSA